jgi:transcriptional regulator with XRE-family HTH domain
MVYYAMHIDKTSNEVIGLGKLLRQRRLAMGLTMKQVADAAGMNLQTYAKKERGLRRVAAPVARRFARVLGCSLEEIVDDP